MNFLKFDLNYFTFVIALQEFNGVILFKAKTEF